MLGKSVIVCRCRRIHLRNRDIGCDLEERRTKPVATGMLGKLTNLDEWFYTPSWKRKPLEKETDKSLADGLRNWLVFFDGGNFSTRLIEAMRGCWPTSGVGAGGAGI